jgi:hypothetical protein
MVLRWFSTSYLVNLLSVVAWLRDEVGLKRYLAVTSVSISFYAYPASDK